MVEAAREATRLKIPYDQRPADLFKNLQDALYAIRGRTSLDDLLAALTTQPHPQGADDWRAGVEAAERERIKASIDFRLNEYLCEMKDGYDDSIVGFNEAWDVVTKALEVASARNLQPPVSVEATGAGREVALCSGCGSALPYSGDVAEFRGLKFHFACRPLMMVAEQITALNDRAVKAENELASLRTTPAPSVDSGNVQGWRPAGPRCDECDSGLEDEWRFCPFCARTICQNMAPPANDPAKGAEGNATPLQAERREGSDG